MAIIPPKIQIGRRSNMDDPDESSTPLFIGATLPFFILMIFFYSARMYSRIRPVIHLHWDDFAITLAVIIEIISYSLDIRTFVLTGGRHIAFVTFSKIEDGLKLGLFIFLFTIYSNLLIKVSIAFMLLRIKSNFSWRVGLWSLTASCAAVAVGFTIVTFLQCTPIRAFWTISLRYNGACWSDATWERLGYGWGVYLILTDLIVALLPITFIRHIKRPLREKIVLSCLMGAGLVAMIAGIVKTTAYSDISKDVDFFYKLATIGIWMHLEILIGIIATCVPCLKALSENLLKRFGVHLTLAKETSRVLKYGSYPMKSHGGKLPGSRIVPKTFNSIEGAVWDGSHHFKTIVSSRGQVLSVDLKDTLLKNECISWESTSVET